MGELHEELCELYLLKKSPVFYHKSLVFYQKSHVLYQKSPVFYQKSPAFFFKKGFRAQWKPSHL